MSSIETVKTNNLSQVKYIDGKTWPGNRSSSEPRRGRKSRNKSFQDPLSRPQSVTGQNENKRTKPCSFQDPKFQSEHTNGKTTHIWSKSSSFQDHHPWQQAHKWQNDQNKLISRPSFKTIDKHNGNNGKLSSFQDPLSRPLLQGITQRVKNLNPKYYLPTNEHTKVISDPGRVLRDQPQVESTVAPHSSASRFSPIYVEPGSTQISSTKDLQALYPNSFDRIGDMYGEYDIKIDPQVPPVQHGRCKVPIEHKAEIEKELNEMVHQGIIAKQTEPTPWVSSLTYPKKPNGKLRICLNPKDLNKAIIRENHKAPTLEEIAHVLTGATRFSKVDGNKAFFGMHLTEQASLLMMFNMHLSRYHFSMCPIWTKDESGHLSDVDGWHCCTMSRCTCNTWWHVFIYGKDDKDHDANLLNLFNVAQKEGLVFNSTKCAIKQDSVTFFGGVFSAKGYSPDPGKIQGITDMPAPQTKQELQSFLGAVNYLQTFMPHLSHHTEPLRILLKRRTHSHGTKMRMTASRKLKVCWKIHY